MYVLRYLYSFYMNVYSSPLLTEREIGGELITLLDEVVLRRTTGSISTEARACSLLQIAVGR